MTECFCTKIPPSLPLNLPSVTKNDKIYLLLHVGELQLSNILAAGWPKQKGHGFIGYPKGRNVARALGPSCPCVLCISHSLGLYLLHRQIWLKRERVVRQ